jgi:predicted Zn-dependent protease
MIASVDDGLYAVNFDGGQVDIATFSGITVTDVQTKNMLSNVC